MERYSKDAGAKATNTANDKKESTIKGTNKKNDPSNKQTTGTMQGQKSGDMDHKKPKS